MRNGAGLAGLAGLAERLAEACERYAVPGAQVGLLHGAERLVLCTGTEQQGGPPVSASTPFHAGSIAKALCALVVLDAAERGEVALDTPCDAQSSVPWADTPRSLMAQTSGRPNEVPGDGEDLAAFAGRVGAMARLHAPGRFSYCNAGWSVLDLLLRERTGSTFEELATERVLGGRTWFGEPDGSAKGHAVRPGGAPTAVEAFQEPAASAAGSRWWATAGDLLDFAELHLRRGAGRLDPGLVDLMQVPHAEVPGRTVADAWGLGWALWRRPGHTAFGWAGFTSGHRSYLRCFPEESAALVVLTSSAGPLFQPIGGSALFDDLLPTLLTTLGVAPLPDPAHGPAQTPASELEGDYGPLHLRADGDDLVLTAVVMGEPDPVRLVRSGGDTFEVAGRPPGPVPVAVEAGLLYLGPFAVPRG